MDYSTLISKLSCNDALLQGVMSDIPSDSYYLDLTTADWETRLKNDVFYQDFLSKSKYLWKTPYENEVCRYEESKIQNFNVIVIGCCKFVKPYKGKISKPGIFVVNCEPLNTIARAMMSDLEPSIQLSKEFKFNFVECSRLTCHICNDGADTFSKFGYTVDTVNQPCISDTKVFDGKRVVNRFASQMQKMFSQTFLGVISLQITCRYSYIASNKQKDHRIAGNVLNIIGFSESKLTQTKKIDIGHLVKFDSPEKPEESDFLCEIMSDDTKEPTKPSCDDKCEEPKRKKLKADDGESSDFLSQLMGNDELENTRNVENDDDTEELFII